MADYTNISNVSVEPLAPVTSELMTSLRDNPIAIAEGSLGAPRVQGKALGGMLLGTVTVTGTGEQGITGLDRHGLLRADFNIVNLTDRNLRARYSSDNGSIWGSWQDIVNLGGGAQGSGVMFINLQTGGFSVNGISTSGTSPALLVATGTHTVPADANALQIAFSNTGPTGVFTFTAHGGIE